MSDTIVLPDAILRLVLEMTDPRVDSWSQQRAREELEAIQHFIGEVLGGHDDRK